MTRSPLHHKIAGSAPMRNRKAVALGLWLAVLVVACGERILGTDPAATIAEERMKVMHPLLRKLDNRNVFMCELVEYIGSQARHGYRRGRLVLEGPGRPALVEGSDPKETLNRFHYLRWDGETGRMLLEVDCVMPNRPESAAFALEKVSALAPSSEGSPAATASASTSAGGGWGDETMQCWSFGSVLECDGIECWAVEYNQASRDGAADSRDELQGSTPTEWECDNTCDIWIEGEEVEFFWDCPWDEEAQCSEVFDEFCCCTVLEGCYWDYWMECESGSGGGGGGGGGGGSQTYSVSCSSVVRGETVHCLVVPDTHVDSVSWTFNGSGYLNQNQKTIDPEWVGTGVIAGIVYAALYIGGSADTTVVGSINVIDRSWPWLQNVSYHQGAASPWFDGVEPLETLNAVGWNCELTLGCPADIGSRVFFPQASSGAGYSVAEVTSGPNDGVWYVDSANFEMHLGSNVNPYLLPSSTPLFTVGATYPCVPYMSISIYDYNVTCKGVLVDSLVAVTWRHEDRHGNMSLAMAVTENPRQRIEGVWSSTLSGLQSNVMTVLDQTEFAIGLPTAIAGDDGVVRWRGDLWWWTATTMFWPYIDRPFS